MRLESPGYEPLDGGPLDGGCLPLRSLSLPDLLGPTFPERLLSATRGTFVTVLLGGPSLRS